MTYILSLFLNIISVLLIDRYLPGIAIVEKGAFFTDVLFALIVGFLNASVFPFLLLLGIFPSKLKLAVMNGIISYGAMILAANMALLGIDVDAGGAVFGGGLLWLVSYLINHWEQERWHDRIQK
jgi:uncharacterized membrane protein YvlD (DUF360 family)